MNIRQLARLLRKDHRITHSWDLTGKNFNISKGMAYHIAKQKHDPADPEIRELLGLGPRPCPTCHRKATVPSVDRPLPRRGKFGWMLDVKPDELLSLLDGREVMA
jgi:hypothetical protein